jgi:hypothetical protein
MNRYAEGIENFNALLISYRKFQIDFWSLGIYFLEAASKPHLTLADGVAGLFKMLTYFGVCCAFSSTRALSLSAI